MNHLPLMELPQLQQQHPQMRAALLRVTVVSHNDDNHFVIDYIVHNEDQSIKHWSSSPQLNLYAAAVVVVADHFVTRNSSSSIM
mmetsp:Transcript_27026/g.23123  ORF Transcript_27026/g.23123 Transcript_27026/m.23123 type:complete len:84 (-) Transcript_27026:164-415(-)